MTGKYEERVLLFSRDRTIAVGVPQELGTVESLEAVYQVPAAMLKRKDQLDS